MSRMFSPSRRVRRSFFAAVVVGLVLFVAACGGHSSHDASTDATKAKAVASSSANAAAENTVDSQVTVCVNKVPTLRLATKSGRKPVVTCLEGLVPSAKRSAFGDCVAQAAVTAKVWTKSGRLVFENSGVAKCVVQVTGTSGSSTPTPAASASGK